MEQRDTIGFQNFMVSNFLDYGVFIGKVKFRDKKSVISNNLHMPPSLNAMCQEIGLHILSSHRV